MRHTRDELLDRANREFERLDRIVAALSDADWKRRVARPEGRDPWTVKDALVHVTYWKADVARLARRGRRPAEVRGLKVNDLNHLVYERFRRRTPRDVLAWHRDVHRDVVAALREAPDAWFDKERSPYWPFDLDGHVAQHRLKDIEAILK